MRRSSAATSAREKSAWRWRLLAGGLAVVGVVAPIAAAVALDGITPRAAMMWSSAGLLCLLIAFAVFDWSERDGLLSRIASWEPAIQQMRAASLRLEQIQRRLVELDEHTNEIRATKHLLNQERHNLSLVAAGMVEIRTIIDGERVNLGALAAGVHDMRTDGDRLRHQADKVFTEVRDFSEIVQALRSHLDALSSKLVTLEDRSLSEQRNLGLVAAGLDGVRRSAAGVERFDARQAALEDVLVSIADRLDALSTSPAVCDKAA